MSSDLPVKPSLEQLKKQAKDLLAEHASHSADCCSVLRHLHRFKNSTDQDIFATTLKLADVQFALAMEYGFTTWDELVRHLQDRGLGLSEDSARALARLRKDGVLAKLIGGEPRSIAGGHGGPFTILEIEGPNGRFGFHEPPNDKEINRLKKQKRVGDFLNTIGIQAAQLTILEADERTFGVYKNVEGSSFGSEKLSVGELDSIANQVASLLVRLHEVPLGDACKILGLPELEAKEAAQQYRLGHDWYNADGFEHALAKELGEDKELKAIWEENRRGMAAYRSEPRDLVFGHGDLWHDHILLTKTPEGYRVTGVNAVYNGGLVNLYDEFLRVGSLGLYDGEGNAVGRAIIEAYNRLPGQTRRVEEVPLRHAITAFWFYLAHENTGESRLNLLASAKRTQRRG